MIFRIVAAAIMAGALAGCGAMTIDEYPCPNPMESTLTYDNFGKRFLDQWCQPCHAAAGPGRQGAPSAYDFGSLADAHAWRERIFVRAAADNTSMPPGPDDPPEADRQKLAEWLACGPK